MANLKLLMVFDIIMEHRKVKEAVKTTQNIYDVINTQPYKNGNILKDLNGKKLSLGDVIEINGFLSDAAYFQKPDTYRASTIHKYERISGDTITMSVEPIYPPITFSHITEKDKNFCFLYDESERCMDIEIIHHNEDYDFRFNEWNKYIPVIIDNDKFGKYINESVRVHARICGLPEDIIQFVLSDHDERYVELVSNYIDLYYPNVKAFYLEICSIEVMEKQKGNVCYSYGVELQFPSLSPEEVMNKIKKAIGKEKLGYPTITMNAGSVNVYYMRGNLSLHQYDNKLGFYIMFPHHVEQHHEIKKSLFHKYKKSDE